MGRIDARLAELGIEDPAEFAPKAAGNYAPWVLSHGLVYVSGQIAQDARGLRTGRLGDTVGLEDGIAAARLCGLALIGQLKHACGGDLDRVRRVVKLTGFVAATPEFTDHPKVVNGASDLMVAVFGDDGRHARAAVGVASLPLGVCVEIEGLFEIA